MPSMRRTRRQNPHGPNVVSIPSSFSKHHVQLSLFARSYPPPRMPTPSSVAKLQTLTEKQLDELCEDVVVLLPLWEVGLPAHSFAAGQPLAMNGGGTTTAPISPTSAIGTGGGNNPFTTTAPHTSPPSLPGHGTTHLTSVVGVQTLPGVPPPSHHPSHGAQPQTPTNTMSTAAASHAGHIGNPNHPEMRPPTEADAIALAPDMSIWMRGVPRKRNESRVKLARSFMSGFEGMRALVWDVSLELERRWPLTDQEGW